MKHLASVLTLMLVFGWQQAVLAETSSDKSAKVDTTEVKDDTKKVETSADSKDDTKKADDITSDTTAEKKADDKSTDTPANETKDSKPDLEREKRMADEIVDAILDGDPEYLKDGDHEFLSIFTEADEPKGSVIILHGRGVHPDWGDTIQPVRVGLVEEGWSTLSIQMPVLEKTAKYYDYVPIFPASYPRIEAAIAFLKEKSDKPIILLAHSCGAHMAMSWIREKGDSDIAAYVGIGMGATDYKQPMKEPFPLADMKVPVLDAYGAEDFPAVLKMSSERLEMIKTAGNEQSKQVVVEGADHYFANKGSEATAAVAEWLNGLTFK